MPANHYSRLCMPRHTQCIFLQVKRLTNTPNRLYDTHTNINMCSVHIMAQQYNNLTKCEAHCALAAINIFYVYIILLHVCVTREYILSNSWIPGSLAVRFTVMTSTTLLEYDSHIISSRESTQKVRIIREKPRIPINSQNFALYCQGIIFYIDYPMLFELLRCNT